jgi:hypothetical protein
MPPPAGRLADIELLEKSALIPRGLAPRSH